MSRVIAFTERWQIAEQAAAWLIKLDQQCPPDKADKKAFKEWLSRSDIHRQEFESLLVFWQDQSLTELNVPLDSCSPSTDRAKVKTDQPASCVATEMRWLKRGAALAALVLLSFVLLFVQDRFFFEDSNGYYATAIGKQTTIALADGSSVELNTNSQIKVDFNPQERAVYLLQGEAYFVVEKNPRKPFRVYAGKGRAQAIGTAFSVYLVKDNVDIVVTEGEVALAVVGAGQGHASEPLETNDGHSLSTIGVLKAGEGATLLLAEQDRNVYHQTKNQLLRPIPPKLLEQRHDWRSGLISFRGESLEYVLAEISRYTKLSIEISDPELKSIRIGGQFRIGYIQEMFDVLETNFGLIITELDENRVQISPPQ